MDESSICHRFMENPDCQSQSISAYTTSIYQWPPSIYQWPLLFTNDHFYSPIKSRRAEKNDHRILRILPMPKLIKLICILAITHFISNRSWWMPSEEGDKGPGWKCSFDMMDIISSQQHAFYPAPICLDVSNFQLETSSRLLQWSIGSKMEQRK